MDGRMIYRSRRAGAPLLSVRVKDCPDPTKAREYLEEILETDVRWETTK